MEYSKNGHIFKEKYIMKPDYNISIPKWGEIHIFSKELTNSTYYSRMVDRFYSCSVATWDKQDI